MCSEEQLQEIDRLATAQCKDTTIAEALGFDVKVFQRQFAKRTRQKRAQGKAKLYARQCEKAEAGSDVMLIWLGKQHLEQTDKQDTKVDASATIRNLLGWLGDRRGNSADDSSQD